MPDDDKGRRQFVVLCGVGTCAIAGSVGVPSAIFVAGPAKAPPGGSDARKLVVAKLDELELNVPKRVAVVGDEVDAWSKASQRKLGSVWLLRTGERTVRALSTICPHLGCGVELSSGGKGFACPCHDSAFDASGTRVAGPSPRAMDELPVEILPSGEIAVAYRRFRIGVPGKEEIG